jgi:hypothetical protein
MTQAICITQQQMEKRFVDAGLLTRNMSMATITPLAEVAVQYQLDPLMGELMIYQSRLYITLQGRLRKAQETEKLDGIDTRPGTKDEKTDRGLDPTDYLFRSEVWVKGAAHPFIGWGTVKQTEIGRKKADAERHEKDPYYLPIVSDPAGMAEKRAIAKGLKLAFHIPLPSAEDDYTDSPDGEPTPAPVATVTKTTPKAKVTAPATPKTTPPTKEPPTEPGEQAIDAEFFETTFDGPAIEPTVINQAPVEPPRPVLNNLGQFFTAANQRWGLIRADVEKKLGKASTQFFDLPTEWDKLVSIMNKPIN